MGSMCDFGMSGAVVGIYETFSGPDSVPHRPLTWRCIEMTGTTQSVIVPLKESAKV
jgi:hypothetical protein